MSQPKLNRGFSQLRDTELDNAAQSIITALTGNTAFPTTSPTLTVVDGALTAFRKALAMPKTAARDAAILAARSDLEKQLQALAANLELTPGVTDEQLATSGFDLRKPTTRTSEPVATPNNVRAKTTGVSGEVQVLCDSVPRAKTYQVHYTQDANTGPWTDGGVFGSTRRMVVPGLTRTKDYWFRVRAIGPDGAGAWSDPATILVG